MFLIDSHIPLKSPVNKALKTSMIPVTTRTNPLINPITELTNDLTNSIAIAISGDKIISRVLKAFIILSPFVSHHVDKNPNTSLNAEPTVCNILVNAGSTNGTTVVMMKSKIVLNVLPATSSTVPRYLE